MSAASCIYHTPLFASGRLNPPNQTTDIRSRMEHRVRWSTQNNARRRMPKLHMPHHTFFDLRSCWTSMGWLPMAMRKGLAVWFPLALSQVPSTYMTMGMSTAPCNETHNAAQRNVKRNTTQHNTHGKLAEDAPLCCPQPGTRVGWCWFPRSCGGGNRKTAQCLGSSRLGTCTSCDATGCMVSGVLS